MRRAALLVLLVLLFALSAGLSECRLRYIGDGGENNDGGDAVVGAGADRSEGKLAGDQQKVPPKDFTASDVPQEVQHEMGQVIELDEDNFDQSVRSEMFFAIRVSGYM